jgi:MAP kinase substrate 1
MDAPDRSSSPRSRQLQGPRPPRLAVSKDSHKVKKPPIAPQQRHHQPQQHQARAPVIIYDASPKVIHTKPGDFMALVQRLTGPGAAGAQFDASMEAGPSAPQQPPEFLPSPTAALSPAARLAAIERSVRPLPPAYYVPDDGGSVPLDFDNSFAAVLGPSSRPGILSPAALPPAASTGLFSPMPFDPTSHSWLADLSPFLPSAGTRQPGMEPQFAPSPRSHLLVTPTMPSPATFSVLEFFSNFPDM